MSKFGVLEISQSCVFGTYALLIEFQKMGNGSASSGGARVFAFHDFVLQVCDLSNVTWWWLCKIAKQTIMEFCYAHGQNKELCRSKIGLKYLRYLVISKNDGY